MTAPLLSLLAAGGVHLLFTALVLQRRGPAMARRVRGGGRRRLPVSAWLAQAGVVGAGPREVLAAITLVGSVGGLAGWAVFGAVAPAAAVGAAAAASPLGVYRARRARLRRETREAWPRLIEDVRVQTASLGRSIPLALLDAGQRAPVATMRQVFAAAHREWLLSTDFERTAAVVKAGLADSTADMTCETLLVAHEVGGADLDRRLTALAEDRVADLESRKDAEARQAGARFARWFVLAVPAGMAAVGLSIGDGRAAYATRAGQLAVLCGVAVTTACWAWASAIMRLPDEDRVFAP